MLYIFTSIVATTTPTLAIVSCGKSPEDIQKEKDQEKLNGITNDMVKNALNTLNKWNFETYPSKNLVSYVFHANLNTLKDVNINIHSWKPDDVAGTITIDCTVSKTGLISPATNFNIVISNFFHIPKWTDFDSNIPLSDTSKLLIYKVNDKNLLVKTNNGKFYRINTSNQDWIWKDEEPGFIASTYTDGVVINKVNDNTLLIGTYNNGFYKIDISKPKWVWTPVVFPGSTGNSGFASSIAWINNNTLLVGTDDNGFYKVNTSNINWTWTKENSTILTNDSGHSSSIIKLDNNNLLVFTLDKGIFRVNISQTIYIWTKITIPFTLANLSISVSTVKLDNKTFLIGTNNNGFYKLDYAPDIDNWKWTKEHNPVSDTRGSRYSSLINVSEYNHLLLVGVNNTASGKVDGGFYQVDFSQEPWKWKKIDLGKNVDTEYTNFTRIDDHSILALTLKNGTYKITF